MNAAAHCGGTKRDAAKKWQNEQTGRGKSRFRPVSLYGANRRNYKNGSYLGKNRDFCGSV
jgi:hypothetical protein